ncbi:unnamed protein product [Somion occarium]|uniref:Uncharacterized protein n=1 Tax=Somion occarium TaxID=3059160 RepID=A0ABP1DY13_9APHY
MGLFATLAYFRLWPRLSVLCLPFTCIWLFAFIDLDMFVPSSPRPILKKRVSSHSPSRHDGEVRDIRSRDLAATRKAVQFSPGKTLTQTFPAHPPDVYDRSPIKVSFNQCELPRRNGGGRDRSPCRERGRSRSMSEDIFPSPIRSPKMPGLIQSLPVFEEEEDDDDEADGDTVPLRFGRPNTPLPALNFNEEDEDEDDDKLPLMPLSHTPTLPPLVTDSSESDDSDVISTSPPSERQLSWTTSQDALQTAFSMMNLRDEKRVNNFTRSTKYPDMLSLSSSSQPAAFQQRPRINARRHHVPVELTQGDSDDDEDVFSNTTGVACDSWVLTSHDEKGCLGGF